MPEIKRDLLDDLKDYMENTAIKRDYEAPWLSVSRRNTNPNRLGEVIRRQALFSILAKRGEVNVSTTAV